MSADYKIYKNIMSANPILDNDYLCRILSLPISQLTDVEVTEVVESNTALIIKGSVNIRTQSGTCTKMLFIKTAKRNKDENAYHSMSMNEGNFYKFIKDNAITNIPVPMCYDVFVSEENGEFVIILEDISRNYTAPDSVALTDKNIWFACAESLAKFHAAFWNHSIILSVEEADRNFHEFRSNVQSFITKFSNEFSDNIKNTLLKASEINISLLKKAPHRINSKNNVTICNGDAHIYNFMLPTTKGHNPLIVDFQFWGEGAGTSDLAHLTRLSFSNELKNDIQIPLIKHYHEALLASGVTGYSWEECLRDYRTSAAAMVLIPFYQHNGFGLKYESWINALHGLVYNYEYLNCDELI